MSVRPFVLRRWPWILGGVVLAAAIALPFSIRSRGRARYEEALARLAAAGMGGGLEELKRNSPVVDPGIQARWRRVVERAASCALQKNAQSPRISDWMALGGPEPEGAREVYEADEGLRADAIALLREGIPVAGLLGNWLAAGGGRIDPLGGMRCENLLGVRNLACLFRAQAAFEDDPGPALAALDRMHDAFARPGTLMDGLIGVALADIRDETYARLALRGRLPFEAGRNWLAEETVEPRRAALSLRGERVLFLEPLAEGIASGTITGAAFSMSPGSRPSFGQWLGGRSEASAWWLHGCEASSRVLRYYGEAETALGEARPLPGAPADADSAGALAAVMSAGIHVIASSSLTARQRHRVARAFVRALGDPVERVLPAGGPGELPVVVELTGTERLRVRSDSGGPLPPAWEGIVLPAPPADPEGPRKPFVWGNGFVEADLPPAAR